MLPSCLRTSSSKERWQVHQDDDLSVQARCSGVESHPRRASQVQVRRVRSSLEARRTSSCHRGSSPLSRLSRRALSRSRTLMLLSILSGSRSRLLNLPELLLRIPGTGSKRPSRTVHGMSRDRACMPRDSPVPLRAARSVV